MSEIGKAVDTCVGLGLAPLLKESGFKKKGREFTRRLEQCVHFVQVQASKDNMGSAGKFTINLGVLFPAIDKLVYCEDPNYLDRVSAFSCTFRRRLGQLMPEPADKWWEITTRADLERLSTEIAATWADYGRPWMNGLTTLQEAAIEPNLDTKQRAAISILFGRREEASRLVHDKIQSARNEKERIDLTYWARALKLD